MLRLFRRIICEPVWIIGSLFPLVLLTPYLPGLPRPAIGGLPWRQELVISILLSVTLILLMWRTLRARHIPSLHRPAAFTALLSAFVFTLWIWLSALWAAYPTSAFHYAAQWSMYLSFLWLMSSVANRTRVMRASFITLGVAIWILGISCAVEFWFGAPLTVGELRGNAKPILRASSSFGEITAVATCLYAALALYLRNSKYALVCGATATLAWLSTFQALQRAPLLGAAAGLLLLASCAIFKANCRPRNSARAYLLLLSLFGVFIIQTLPSTGMSASAPSTVERLQSSVREDAGVNIRLLLWGIGLEMLRAHPLQGVGANNYDIAYPEARRRFSARHLDTPFVNSEEQNLAVYAHNEYIQLAAELGVIGFTLLIVFYVLLAHFFWRALRHPRKALPALGAGGAVLAFALSSCASPASFRSLGGGMLFFFAAAVIIQVASSDLHSRAGTVNRKLYVFTERSALCCALVVLCVTLSIFCKRATGSVFEGLAQASADPDGADRLYRQALRFNSDHAPLHYSFGLWLFLNGRAAESVPHLRYAVEQGFNSSTCYAYLAEAEKAAGDMRGAERTTAQAARVYPRSIFALVRHAVASRDVNDLAAAEDEYRQALALDERGARGWWYLLNRGRRVAGEAARSDTSIASPGELTPEACVHAVTTEEELKYSKVVLTGKTNQRLAPE